MQTQVKLFLFFLGISLSFISKADIGDPVLDSTAQEKACKVEYEISDRYCSLGDSTLQFDIFQKAYVGYLNMVKLNKVKKKDTLTIVDFSQGSLNERMYIIDLKSNKIIHKSVVAHGMNSGRHIPKYFSNEEGSKKSSLGFYTIDNTYKGKFDLAVKLNGLEYSNSHAHRRGVVIHAAKYANVEWAKKNGALGRSFGCPAIPEKDFEKVVEMIKGGSTLFIYAPNRSYLRRSKLINRQYYLK